jgi:pseudouridine-5'-monophosphatase
MPISHVLFDLDGVLLDTERLYTEATQAVVTRFGKTYDWGLKRHIMGRDARFGARLVIERLGLPIGVDELLRQRKPVLEALLEDCRAMAGAEDFVRGLHEKGIPMGIATSSDRALYELKTQRHGFFGLFRAVVCGDDPRVRAKKPAPDVFLAAARDLDVEPSACVVFEDSPAGVEAALAAGMRVIAMPDPALDSEAFGAAHHVLRRFADVTPWHLGLNA